MLSTILLCILSYILGSFLTAGVVIFFAFKEVRKVRNQQQEAILLQKVVSDRNFKSKARVKENAIAIKTNKRGKKTTILDAESSYKIN
jgi:hypothetical protein